MDFENNVEGGLDGKTVGIVLAAVIFGPMILMAIILIILAVLGSSNNNANSNNSGGSANQTSLNRPYFQMKQM